jgi:hypothetical protein
MCVTSACFIRASRRSNSITKADSRGESPPFGQVHTNDARWH